MVADLSLSKTADFLKENDNYLILTHAHPDGDTIGSGFALKLILEALGKRAIVINPDEIPQKYSVAVSFEQKTDFDIKTIVAVDVADTKLLGSLEQEYKDRIDLCIDHHPSNIGYSKYRLLVPTAAAACEIFYSLAVELGVRIDQNIANAIYLGISTDTGCFKFANTTHFTHFVAAEIMKCGANVGEINRQMFETNSKERLALETAVIGAMEYYFDGSIAFATIPYDLLVSSGCNPDDIDGISSIPRTIKGVKIGITMRENEPGSFKFSVRTFEPFDASSICKRLGGGGHKAAAGCSFKGSAEDAKQKMLESAKKELFK